MADRWTLRRLLRKKAGQRTNRRGLNLENSRAWVPAPHLSKLLYCPRAVECSKLGLDWAFGLGRASLGLPQGNLSRWDFRRMSVSALRCSIAHARSDSLEHSAAVCHAGLFSSRG